ncbi:MULTISPECIES: hypothetical protein [unclassified Isoptericola]|uniref:hypothetical protein n=1 Tax=unclassified Isoptericola TaxID=2623355 RepID=UPI0027128070|nr:MULTISPECIES: hypothetical protein [unclassified Isoptericola]MDO8145221.1 hypothetical protein [Isoptericola sp. 178]MDO8148859.1 hypothetical protein [Isoptericola sp. b515]
MHVLLVTAADDGGADREPWTPLAAAWTEAAPRCVVEPMVLPPGPVAATAPPGEAPAPGVFVPTTSLGLTSVTPPPPPPEVRLLQERVAHADLVVVHTPVLDGSALRAGPVHRAAEAAAPYAVPVVVLAGRDETTRRELSGAGVAGAHEIGEPPSGEAVGRVARTWAPAWAAPEE